MSNAGDVVREVIDRAWNRGDLEVLSERVAVGYRRQVPDGLVQGRDGFRDRIVATRAAFPDFHTRVDAMIEQLTAEPQIA